MTENSDPNGHVTDEDLEFIKQINDEDLRHAEDRLDYYPAPRWWIAEAYYDDLD